MLAAHLHRWSYYIMPDTIIGDTNAEGTTALVVDVYRYNMETGELSQPMVQTYAFVSGGGIFWIDAKTQQPHMLWPSPNNMPVNEVQMESLSIATLAYKLFMGKDFTPDGGSINWN